MRDQCSSEGVAVPRLNYGSHLHSHSAEEREGFDPDAPVELLILPFRQHRLLPFFFLLMRSSVSCSTSLFILHQGDTTPSHTGGLLDMEVQSGFR